VADDNRDTADAAPCPSPNLRFRTERRCETPAVIRQPFRVVPAGKLAHSDRVRWRQWLYQDADLPPSPFLTAEYAEHAHAIVPGGEVARIERGGSTVGFWAFQRRGGAIQPLGAPLTDYQGVVSSPEVASDIGTLIGAAGANRYCFTGLNLPGPPRGQVVNRTPMIADLRGGFEAYYARRSKLFRKYFNDKRRLIRQFEGEIGPATFTWHDDDPLALKWLLDRKRAQFRETAQYDIFSCGWTERLLRRLVDVRTPRFGGSISTMRAQGKLIAAVYTLRAGPACHIWFPAYDPAHGRFSPGALSMLNLLRLAADEGVEFVDFGLEGDQYKRYFAEPRRLVYEGCIRAAPAPADEPRPSSIVDPRELGRIDRLLLKARRRRFILSACEPEWGGRMVGLMSMTALMIHRRVQWTPTDRDLRRVAHIIIQ
jgi:CelD/BcsL family acetyltransferase involved in cellulose biosynthesis